MPSSSALKYNYQIGLARLLRQSPSESKSNAQTFYHASLAASVAAWDAYINNLVKEFFSVTTDPLLTKYHHVHNLLLNLTDVALKKFNTPNWENSRNFLVIHTGYDPINDWVWLSKGMATVHVQERLNQILKVRHSFAHGFSIPAFPWTQSPSGKIRLTSKGLIEVEAFLSHLVRQTDKGINSHICNIFHVTPSW